jgi:hypothetical protein
MSSSKGNVISVADALEVAPPEVLRYLVLRTRPMKAITFDPGLPLLALVDEYDDARAKNRDDRAIALSRVSGIAPVGIPFKHTVVVLQIARLMPAARRSSENGYRSPVERPACGSRSRSGWIVSRPMTSSFQSQRSSPRSRDARCLTEGVLGSWPDDSPE